jgi:hypothetical protein
LSEQDNLQRSVVLQVFFEEEVDKNKYCGHLYGLGTAYVTNGNASTSDFASEDPNPATSSSGS